MANTSQWELFGFDLRQLGRFFKRAWFDVFFAYNAPLRKWLDVPVTVYRWDGERAPVLSDEPPSTPCAILLPDELVLKRTLVLPRSALVNLAPIIAAEVDASSPFKTAEIALGTSVSHLQDKKICVRLAIASRAGVMELLHGLNAQVAPSDYEIRAEHEGDILVLEGFGEPMRNKLYRKRLGLFAGNVMAGVAALLVLLALPLAYQKDRQKDVEQLLADSRQEARVAMRYRTSLAESNARLSALQERVRSGVKPLEPLLILSSQIDDNAWLGNYEQEKNVITVDGFSANAAELIQKLTASENFTEVKPVSAIRKLGRAEVERFSLELYLATQGRGSDE